jgi:hypothetical protein
MSPNPTNSMVQSLPTALHRTQLVKKFPTVLITDKFNQLPLWTAAPNHESCSESIRLTTQHIPLKYILSLTTHLLQVLTSSGSHGSENDFVCHFPDDGGSKHFWNNGKLLPDYMVQHPKILYVSVVSSCSIFLYVIGLKILGEEIFFIFLLLHYRS